MGFLIDFNYLKDRINITDQKDPNELRKSLQNCKDFYLDDLLGIPLYDLFDQAVNGTGTTLTANQAYVLEKVKLYAALIVESDLMFVTFYNTNKGMSTDVNQAALDLIQMRKNLINNRAEKIKSEIVEFITKNKSDFPEYFEDEVSENKGITATFSPIVFATNNRKFINE